MEKIIISYYILFLSLLLVACADLTEDRDYVSSSYEIESGDIITISIPSEYVQVEEIPFMIKKESVLICEGNFTSKENYSKFIQSLSKENIIEDENINKNEYCLIIEEGQYKAFVSVNNSDTVVSIKFHLTLEEIKEFMSKIKFVSNKSTLPLSGKSEKFGF